MQQTFRIGLLASALASVSLLGGCATATFGLNQAEHVQAQQTSKAIANFAAARPQEPKPQVRVINSDAGLFTRTSQAEVDGDVNLTAASAPFGPLVQQIAAQSGYSVAFSSGVQLNRLITVKFTNGDFSHSIQTVAYLAGYAAVVNREQHTVYISPTATYIFRLPSSVFSQLQAKYSIGGNPVNSASGTSGSTGSSSSSSSNSGSSGGTSLSADFTVKGQDGSNAKGLVSFLEKLAGKNASVLVDDSGLVTVTGNAQALHRMHEFLENFAKNAMTQVDIQASIVDVTLSNQFSMGIQWGKVLAGAGPGGIRGAVVGMPAATAADVTSGNIADTVSQIAQGANSSGLSAFRVGASSSSIINALAQFTTVKVESQPHLVTMNNVPATFFNGTQIPYLGSTQQTAASTTSAQPTVTGSVSFAVDGLSFSVVPSVISRNAVQITLVPVLTSVGSFSNFLNGTLQAPQQTNKESYMRVLAESGKTLILGGIRYTSDNRNTSVAANTSSQDQAHEVVILLRAKVIAPPKFDPLIDESL